MPAFFDLSLPRKVCESLIPEKPISTLAGIQLSLLINLPHTKNLKNNLTNKEFLFLIPPACLFKRFQPLPIWQASPLE